MIEIQTDYVEACVYHRPKYGNEESGDAYFIHTEEDYLIFAIADGLGSGPFARQSAEIIPDVLAEYHHESLDELLNRCNEYMIQKRGAAVAIVKVDFKDKTIQYSCVGNVRFYIWQNDEKMIYPLPVMGYLSGRPLKLNTQIYSYYPGDRFILHSDGIELRSPTSLLKNACCTFEVYENVVGKTNADDDATFITGDLLR
ncbi:PP2C family serine/threonine-protein phosphatase [Sporosarcina ureilytica]|uniref:Phosphoserine phosphatase n=1 Tax=Sporosarcina ureilytica TaxID=298596 RepID=A0A1D8JD86_9BACL|nr:PP2C family serine/threonine-protein phosphatase [Sporosarcina ureilytica]AOV06677.1 phosphoserine phosphatase [Sporosarcina ureilytica]